MSLPVAILIVIHNDAEDLPNCLAAVGALEPPPQELWIIDCLSTDDGVSVARHHWPAGLAGDIIVLEENLGFAGGMNVGITASRAAWVLTLNADALPAPDYLKQLLALSAAHTEIEVGGITGRLSRFPDPGRPPTLDACGMYLTPTWRHLDRESGAVDRGQQGRAQRVFGATGAASLFRRVALLDIAVDGPNGGEVFDESFHTYREDAELCFRLRSRSWEILYQPTAVAQHRRLNLPSRRSAIPARFNYHSLKNRYLIRAYHQTLGNFLWTLPATLLRDGAALAWVCLFERTSLASYRWLWTHRGAIMTRRRAIQSRRTAPAWHLDRWFLRRSLPLAWSSPHDSSRDGESLGEKVSDRNE